MLFYETDPCTVSGFPGMGGEIFCIQIIERLKAHVRRSLLLLQEGAFPGGGVPFGFKAPFQLLAAFACPVLIGKFTVPGITGFIFVLCHIHFPFICRAGAHGWKEERNSRLFFTREQGGYFLCVYVRIATISNATDTINCNSSYVLISIPSLPRLRAGTAAALLAAWVNILYCQCIGCPYLGHSGCQ